MAENSNLKVFASTVSLSTPTAGKLSVQTLKLLGYVQKILKERAGTVASYIDNRNLACLTNHRETQCW